MYKLLHVVAGRGVLKETDWRFLSIKRLLRARITKYGSFLLNFLAESATLLVSLFKESHLTVSYSEQRASNVSQKLT